MLRLNSVTHTPVLSCPVLPCQGFYNQGNFLCVQSVPLWTSLLNLLLLFPPKTGLKLNESNFLMAYTHLSLSYYTQSGYDMKLNISGKKKRGRSRLLFERK